MAEFDAAAMFAESPVAMLATSGPDGAPHIVPVVFAVHDDMVYTAVDAKRKSTQRLRRLANIEGNPQVSMLVDHYEDDWDAIVVGAGRWHRIDPLQRRGDGCRLLAATPEIRSVPTDCAGRPRHHRQRPTVVIMASVNDGSSKQQPLLVLGKITEILDAFSLSRPSMTLGEISRRRGCRHPRCSGW